MNQLRITPVQTLLHWESEEKNLQMLTLLLQGLKGKTDLVVLPEMFNSGFSMQPHNIAQPMNGTTILWMQQQAKLLGAAICGSIAVIEDANFLNRFLFVRPNGVVESYDKRHCFRMSGEHEVYKAGKQRKIIQYLGWRILPQICYDLRFPVFSRNINDYDLMIYVANWPAVRCYPWRVLLQGRAVENLAYVVGVNRIGADGNGIEYRGDSLVLDYKGEVLVDHQSEADLRTQILDLDSLNHFKAKFPAWMDADNFSLENM
jgi:predicted amidohydrolase